MTLTPQDVERQVFQERRRGYDPEEVDQFLDRVTESIGALIAERDRAHRRVAELEESSEGARESETLLRRTLMTAERTAQQTVADAEQEAAQLREEARREAAELVETAEAEAAELRRAVEAEAAELRRAAEAEAAERRRTAEDETARNLEESREGVERVRRAVAELRDFREEYRERVQAVIAEQLAALDRVGELPEVDPHVSEVANLPGDGWQGQQRWS